MIKKLMLAMLMVCSAAFAQNKINLPNQALGGGSIDTVLQGGTTAPNWLTIPNCNPLAYNSTTHVFYCGTGGGSGGVFSSYQFAANPAMTGAGIYYNFTYSGDFTSTHAGAGTIGSPFLDTLKLASSISANAATASALAGSPTQCAAQFQTTTGIAASGNANCQYTGAQYRDVTTNDTVLATDHTKGIQCTGSGAVTETLPTAVTLGTPYFNTQFINAQCSSFTISAASWLIYINGGSSGASSLVIYKGQSYSLTVDPGNAAWNVVGHDGPLIQGSNITLTHTPTGTQIDSTGGGGSGANPQGTYNSGTTYAADDLITYNGIFYVSLLGSNTGNTPTPAGSSYWQPYTFGLPSDFFNPVPVSGVLTLADQPAGTVFAAVPLGGVPATIQASDFSYATGGGTALSVPLTTYAVTPGDSLVLMITAGSSTCSSATVTDDHSDTFNYLPTGALTGSWGNHCWFLANGVAGGTTTISVTGTTLEIAGAVETTSISTGSPLDGYNGCSATTSGCSITTTTAGDILIVGISEFNGTVNYTASSPFTLLSEITTQPSSALAYAGAVNAGTYSAGFQAVAGLSPNTTSVIALKAGTPSSAPRFRLLPNVVGTTPVEVQSTQYVAIDTNYGTDDTTAMQSAITAACASPGGTLVIAPGEYKITSALTLPNKGCHIRGAGTNGGGPGSGGPQLASVSLGCFTSSIATMIGGTTSTMNYQGPWLENIQFVDKTGGGTCGGGLLLINQSYATLTNLGFQGFALAATAAPSTPSLTPGTSGSLTAGTYDVAITETDAIGHETLAGTPSTATTTGSSGSIAIASHTTTSPMTKWNVYAGSSASTLHLISQGVSSGSGYTITALANTHVSPPSFDESAGYGLNMFGTSSGLGSASTGYSNQNVLSNVQTLGGTVDGIVADRNNSSTYITSGNLNLASNTAGCGAIIGYGEVNVHTEGGASGSTRFCADNYNGSYNIGLDVLSTGEVGFAGIGLGQATVETTSSVTSGTPTVVTLDATSSHNNIIALGSGSSSAITDNGTYNQKYDGQAQTFVMPFATTLPSLTLTGISGSNKILSATSGVVSGVTPTSIVTSAFTSTSWVSSGTMTWALASTSPANTAISATHNTTSTLDITGPVNGGNYVVTILQDSTGTGTTTLDLGTGCTNWYVSNSTDYAIATSVAITATANHADVLSFTYDGTNCWASYH